MTIQPNARWAFARYRALAHLYPSVPRGYPPFSLPLATLEDVASRYDGFILDAFGVLNVGEQVIEGAVERMKTLRAMGKRLVVLTNGASASRREAVAKYQAWGFDFDDEAIISSRDLMAQSLADRGGTWCAIAPRDAAFDDLPARVVPFSPEALDKSDGILLLGSQGWTAQSQDHLIAALKKRPRPVLCANPDIVAPRDDGFTWEPGHFAADLPVPVEYFGKPHKKAFDAALARLGLPANRVAMVGDSLHTDILGGRAAGCFTVLVSGHGFFAGTDPTPYIQSSGIVPDFIIPTT